MGMFGSASAPEAYGRGRSSAQDRANDVLGAGFKALNDPRVSRFNETQQRGCLGNNLGFGMMGSSAGDLGSYYDQVDYTAKQQKIRDDYLNRLSSSMTMKNDIDWSSLGWEDRTKALGAWKTGKMDVLDSLGFDTKDMRDTHHKGGLLGGMFGVSGDDVQTLQETQDNLGEVDPNNPMGYSSLGYGLGVVAPGAANFVAQYTQNPYAGYGAYGAGKIASSRLASSPTAYKAAGLAGGLLGVPGASQAAGIFGLANRAADLNYAGYTGSADAPQRNKDKESDWWPVAV